MTPFGKRIRELRAKRGIKLKQMASDLHVSEAYISALEHGNRGRPAPGLVMQVANYFELIWDEVDELKELAELSHPRVPINTSGLEPEATLLANVLSKKIHKLKVETIIKIINEIDPKETRER